MPISESFLVFGMHAYIHNVVNENTPGHSSKLKRSNEHYILHRSGKFRQMVKWQAMPGIANSGKTRIPEIGHIFVQNGGWPCYWPLAIKFGGIFSIPKHSSKPFF